MIDWITAVLPVVHPPLETGLVCKINPDSSVEWASPCRVSVTGSFESSIQVRSLGSNGAGCATELHFHGNPSKFLQGHNVFGSDDLLGLMYDAFVKVCASLELSPTEQELEVIRAGEYDLSRVDINYSFELPSRADVLAWLRAAEFKSRTRHGRPASKGGTLYWGKTSRRWSIKAYSKGEELEVRGRGIPDQLSGTPLKQWADNKLRIELTLRSKQLKELNKIKASALDEATINELYMNYLEHLEMTEQLHLTDKILHELPQNLRSTYVLWRAGHDCRSTLSKATYYRHRKELLPLGIDIAISREGGPDMSNVVPLVRVLEAKPVPVPQWAFEQRLVHCGGVA